MRRVQDANKRRQTLRTILFIVILGTLPFYCLGIWLWGTSPESNAQQATETISPTWTPIGGDITVTLTLMPSITPLVTGTLPSPLQPTPFQFQPPAATRFLSPTPQVFIPTSTSAPTLTPASSDSDGDGVPNASDQCPNTPGTVAGCPDADGDGIRDSQDQCPTVAGVSDYSGCPIPDSDGDGVLDPNDQCPNQAGTAANNGCPAPTDSDNDGVPDSIDQCPNQAGTAGNNGCPAPRPGWHSRYHRPMPEPARPAHLQRLPTAGHR